MRKIFDNLYYDILLNFGKLNFKYYLNKKEYTEFTVTEEIRNYIKNVSAEKVQKVTDSTKQEIKQIILKNLESGNSISQIESDIRKTYREFGQARARKIAVTEVASISNYASLIGAKQAGMKQKKWIIMDDIRVRVSHQDMEKVPYINIDSYFNVGNSVMLFPGDFKGEAKEVIYCRCWLVFK